MTRLPRTQEPAEGAPSADQTSDLRVRLQWWAHKTLPGIVESPNAGKMREWHWQRDQERNQKETPSDQDRSRLYCSWAAELYPPSRLDSLLNGLTRLGWNDENLFHSSQPPASWLRDIRDRGTGQGWLNLGIIVPPGSKRSFLPTQEIRLPASVEFAEAHLFSISPSLAAVIVCFVFEEAHEQVFDRVLRTKYQTWFEPFKGGHRIHTPRYQRFREIDRIRGDMQSEMSAWFQEHLPGAFSSSRYRHHLPVCEFLVFTQPEPQGNGLRGSRDYLIGGPQWSIWSSREVTGLAFALSGGETIASRFHTCLIGNEKDFQSFDMSAYGGHDKGAYLARFGGDFANLICLWSCMTLLDMYQAQISNVRDSEIYSARDTDPKKLLDDLRGFTATSMDIASITPDLCKLTHEDTPILFEGVDFTRSSFPVLGAEVTLSKMLGDRAKDMAERVQLADRSLRELLLQQGNLAGAAENVKVQRGLRMLTWAMLGLTIATLLVGMVAIMPSITGFLDRLLPHHNLPARLN